MKPLGIVSLAVFIRMLIHQFPFREGKQWSDDDMKTFAKGYATRKANPPYVLQTEEKQLDQELETFKSSRS